MDLFILKYITFEPKKTIYTVHTIPLTSSLSLVKKSFIDNKSYIGCSDERECLYFYVNFLNKFKKKKFVFFSHFLDYRIRLQNLKLKNKQY
jgi:hypothetical protein